VKPDIGSESLFLPTRPAFDTPIRGVLVGVGGLLLCRLVRKNYITMTFGVEKVDWCGYPVVKKNFENMFIRFDRIHERDGQTDRHRMTT